MTEEHLIEAVDPDEVFALLADETRILILQALWEAESETLSFSTLRESVGMRDAGQFNYHLGKLVGHLIKKTDDGYTLSPAGESVIGAILSGAFTMKGDVTPIQLPNQCSTCDDEPLWFEVDQNYVTITCNECEKASTFPIPPSVLAGYPAEAFPSVAQQYVRTLIQNLRRGFCPTCSGAVQPTIGTFGDGSNEVPSIADQVVIRFQCDKCGQTHQNDPVSFFLSEPVVVSYFHTRGVNIEDISIWNLSQYVGEPASTTAETDQRHVTLTFTTEEDCLTLTVDDSLDIIESMISER